MQKSDIDKNPLQAICFCSRTLTDSERKWPIIKGELAAIVYALRCFKPYIFMSRCIVHSDHKPLSHILKKGSTNTNLARWIIEVLSYNVEIVYIEGTKNQVADALSRVGEDQPSNLGRPEMEDIIEFPVSLPTTVSDGSSRPSCLYKRCSRNAEKCGPQTRAIQRQGAQANHQILETRHCSRIESSTGSSIFAEGAEISVR